MSRTQEPGPRRRAAAARAPGPAGDAPEGAAAPCPVDRALREIGDGLLLTDGAGRIVFANPAAGRLLDPGAAALTGRSLGGLPRLRAVPGLEERCRRVASGGRPTGFDTAWPGTDLWYHVRLVPAADGGLLMYLSEVPDGFTHGAGRPTAAERAQLTGKLTRQLAEAVSTEDVVKALTGSVMPAFGATGLNLLHLRGGRLEVVGIAGYPAAFRERMHGLPLAARTPVTEALRARTPQFLESRRAAVGRFPEAAELTAASGKQAWAFLPLTVSGRAIGTAVISFDRPRRFPDDERGLLNALSGLVAQALERARLYDEAASRARHLQRALLPRTLPDLPVITAAARFLPAGAATEVGGDWYDVIRQSAGRVALVAGDVMGHGMAEAATMGRLRTAMRTLSSLELPPDELLAHLNDLIRDLSEEWFATCLYGVYDPVTRTFAYANAGHPPPAHVRPDATVTFPDEPVDPPLGAASPPFHMTTLDVPEGSLLVLYTDGLVESPRRDIGEGMERLAHLLRTRPADDLDALCDTLAADLLPADQPPDDDAALLVVRPRPLAPRDIAAWPLPEDPRAAREARGRVREQLAAWELGEELTMTTELIVSELVGNVIRHASGPLGLRLLRSGSLICEVSDGSLTTPHIRHPSLTDEGGRGLHLVAALAHRWGTRHTEHGKTIWTEQPLAP
ncbi:SpoIIE family protein phosphatase [Streptomyces sp. DSM 44917]|uniref:SpoIIE family protein phosphatase n=1 Tax=Streptomyces boetiae TaxID=3075541 RepID=A0ABU2L7K2_9ACTN|nr:SpoIIE family protein phosphatase [Streptomyces sp. DSM 44917]MDT0307546.1 SpoIIE family protein phosphatase [Streptomyces sp. DSM 44917]